MAPDNNSLELYVCAFLHRPGHPEPLPIPPAREFDMLGGFVHAILITLFGIAVFVGMFALTTQVIAWRGLP